MVAVVEHSSEFSLLLVIVLCLVKRGMKEVYACVCGCSVVLGVTGIV